MRNEVLEWEIAHRKIRLSATAGSVPKKISEAFPFNAASDEFGRRVDVVLEARFNRGWSNLQAATNVKVICNKQSGEESLAVELPFASGVLSLRKDYCYGNFDLGTKNTWGLQNALRTAMALVVEREGGLLLHASAVWCDGKVWVFCGPSGAGKTTIAVELLRDGVTFSEDLTVIKFDEQNVLTAYSTPFHSTRDLREYPNTAPVAGIAIIQQSTRTRLSEIQKAQAAMALFRQSQWYSRNATHTIRALDNISPIVESNLCWALEFEKSTELWKTLSWR